MSKTIDITDKMSFEDNPIVRVRDVEIELNADALNLIDVLREVSQEGFSARTAASVICRLFADPDDIEKLRPLKLKMKDFIALYTECIGIIVGNGDSEGEAPTPATT